MENRNAVTQVLGVEVIHYHGTPCGGPREQVAKFLRGRHALIPFLRPEDVATAAEECQSMCFDNSAYTAWKQGVEINWSDYYAFCDEWHRHPAFDWAIIPDVIDGSEQENDALLHLWPDHIAGVPVWHMHESLDRLDRLCSWPRIALGSSGSYATVGDARWWYRMGEAMSVICDGLGRPRARLHGLRMLNPTIFRKLPLASADSTNVVRNANLLKRYGHYPSPNISTRMSSNAERIELHQSSAVWLGAPVEESYTLFG